MKENSIKDLLENKKLWKNKYKTKKNQTDQLKEELEKVKSKILHYKTKCKNLKETIVVLQKDFEDQSKVYFQKYF